VAQPWNQLHKQPWFSRPELAAATGERTNSTRCWALQQAVADGPIVGMWFDGLKPSETTYFSRAGVTNGVTVIDGLIHGLIYHF
jgi:hypothetical protein